ncbi:MAG: hypothetical protein B0D92_02865 [Spirochaeta sp. LUC14_002_19_P3]|nr:MAG: hypothetical protein B0D92_02865 [Spirochaeta sp. LUC14_002_19_P3]
MGFGEILEEWDGQQGKKNAASGQRLSKSKKVRKGTNGDWLSSYLPTKEIVAEKEQAPYRPVSAGSSVWRKRLHQDTLDLHGLSRREAEMALERFIQSMRRRGLKKGLIIHGKGLHSMGDSKLAPMVRGWLERSKEVGQSGRAPGKHGGSGATWFILKME